MLVKQAGLGLGALGGKRGAGSAAAPLWVTECLHDACRRETGAFPDVVILSAGEWYHQEKRSVQQLHADVEDLSAAVIEADAAAGEASAGSCLPACSRFCRLDSVASVLQLAARRGRARQCLRVLPAFSAEQMAEWVARGNACKCYQLPLSLPFFMRVQQYLCHLSNLYIPAAICTLCSAGGQAGALAAADHP